MINCSAIWLATSRRLLFDTRRVQEAGYTADIKAFEFR